MRYFTAGARRSVFVAIAAILGGGFGLFLVLLTFYPHLPVIFEVIMIAALIALALTAAAINGYAGGSMLVSVLQVLSLALGYLLARFAGNIVISGTTGRLSQILNGETVPIVLLIAILLGVSAYYGGVWVHEGATQTRAEDSIRRPR